MSLQYINRSFRYITSFGETNFDLIDRITSKIYFILYLYKNKKNNYQQHYSSRIYLLCIFIFIFLILFFILYSLQLFSISNDSDVLENYTVSKSTSPVTYEHLILNIKNQSTHHIYIDIGCFNGETIEHFIHFNSDSHTYDIITFEPDPVNYLICKRKLSKKKYRKYNIIIIPKVVWIRNEKVLYQIDRGHQSRIDTNKTHKYHLEKLDAIDFSSWLSHLIKPNNTKLHIKLSATGIEVKLLLKMITDGTLSLADKWDIEWTNRYNSRTRPARIYVQSMFESLGYDCKYLTRLPDERLVFQKNGTYGSVAKYRDWHKIALVGTYTHCFQRPDIRERPHRKRIHAK